MGAEYEQRKANYDQVLFRVKKGKAGEYKQAAAELGIGFWELIQSGVEEYIANHAGEKLPAAKPEEKLTADEKKLAEEFSRLPTDAQKYLLKFVRAINQKGGDEND